MKHINRSAAAVVALVVGLALSACSGGGGADSSPAEVSSSPARTPSASPSPVDNIGDTWTFKYKGATGSFKLTGNQQSPAVSTIDGARQAVGGDPVTLIPVEVDNTAGSASINLYGLTLVALDGQQTQSVDLADSFSSWREAAGDDVDKYNALVDAENDYGQFLLQPGAKGTGLVAFSQPPSSAARVYVMPAGGDDQVEAESTPGG